MCLVTMWLMATMPQGSASPPCRWKLARQWLHLQLPEGSLPCLHPAQLAWFNLRKENPRCPPWNVRRYLPCRPRKSYPLLVTPLIPEHSWVAIWLQLHPRFFFRFTLVEDSVHASIPQLFMHPSTSHSLNWYFFKSLLDI